MPPETDNSHRHRPTSHAERLAVLETWKADHEDRCRERYEGLGNAITEMKTAAAGRAVTLKGVEESVNELKMAFGVRAIERSDGTKQVKTRVLKFDSKLMWSIIGGAGGLVVLYQILFPTIAAMALAFHHAIIGVGG